MTLHEFGERVDRFVIRTLRVAGGIVLFFVVLMFPLAGAADRLSMPFGAMSPLDLVTGLALGVVGLLGLVVAFGLAFGQLSEQTKPPAQRS